MVNMNVMAVPERLQFVQETYPRELLERARVRVDVELRGAWPPLREAFEDALKQDDCKYVLTLQDDLSFCQDFVETVDKIVCVNSGKSMSLFSPYGKLPKMAHDAGARWFGRRDPLWAQALLLPVEIVQGILHFADGASHLFTDKHDDVRIAAFHAELGEPMWCAVPSFVQHEGASRSVLGQSNSRRIADYFIGVDKSAKDFDWTIYGGEPVGQVGNPFRWSRG
jgi:hypothetical protein